jgi:uncharacterized protein
MYTAHVAIPAVRLADAIFFYERLGATIGRKYDTHVVMDFFGIQLVAHKSMKYEIRAEMYPRHFGVIFDDKKRLLELYSLWKMDPSLKEFFFEDWFMRHEGKPEEHETFFLKDRCNNVIEFKYYKEYEFRLK